MLLQGNSGMLWYLGDGVGNGLVCIAWYAL